MTPMPYSTEIVQDGDVVMVLFSDDSIRQWRCRWFNAKHHAHSIKFRNPSQIEEFMADLVRLHQPAPTPRGGGRVPGLSYGSDSLASRFGYWGR